MLKKMTMSLGRGLALALLLAPIGVFGDQFFYDFFYDDLYYDFVDDSKTQARVMGLQNPYATHITIPATVVYEYTDYSDKDDEGNYRIKRRTCTVTSIGGGAFSHCSSLASVTIPSSVTSIGGYAFSGCTSLVNITIPNSVTVFWEGAFSGCSSLANVTISDGVTSIGAYAFSGCSSLTSVTIPSSVTDIGNYAFQDCNGIRDVTVPQYVCNRSLYSIFPSYQSITNVVILDGATSIGGLYGCSSLASVTIPSSVTSIRDYAFEGCSSLASVTIPSSVTDIGNSAFYGCSSLASVTIPSSVTSIGGGAFSRCSSLASVTIPSSVTSIGDNAFYNCSSLASVTMPQCAIANPLYNSRFYCSGGVPIHRLGLDATVSAIHENAFYQCKSLTTIEVDADNEHYFVSPMDGCLYDINQTTLLCCPRDKTSVTIPYGVTKIANYAFAYCSNLVSVTMPVTLTTIGENAFLDCASLPTAAIPDSVSSIGNYAFGNCRKLSGVTIPSSVKALSTSAFNNCDILWTEWCRTLADFAVNGRAYDLTQTPADRAIADVSVSGDTALDAFVLKEGKVYDSVLYIHNNAGHSVRVTLPSMPQTSYQTFKGASPLTLPAYSTSILTITRVAGGNAGGNVFLVTREELETIQ